MQQQMNNPQQDVRLQGGYSPQQKPKKPIYKKWWFWVIIAVIPTNFPPQLGQNFSLFTFEPQYGHFIAHFPFVLILPC